jgi:hypothetical protein
MAEQRAEKKNHECEENNLRYFSSRCGDSCESEECRDQRDDKKSQSPFQHFASQENFAGFKESEIYWAFGAAARRNQVQSPFRLAKKSRMSFYFCTI